ncbi:hypothetical protein N7G274_007317 [Stereocaulon virgatum]|uniref:Uncharacterized protein n=1 Tax=Stereocaulon virgatum TaxID=373712 RepID=A0ABR4A1S8_9LECA
MTEAHVEEWQKSSWGTQAQSGSALLEENPPKGTGKIIKDLGTELASLRSLAVSGFTPETYACFYEKVESIITSILEYLGIPIDSSPKPTNGHSQHVHQEAILRTLSKPSHPFFQILGQGPVYDFLHDSNDFRNMWRHHKETSAAEASAASNMPEAAVLSSHSYALHEALETAFVCVKKEAGRRFSHKDFWEIARLKELSLDVREQLIEKQERRIQKQESEHCAAISRKAALDLREVRLLLRETDLQVREDAVHDDVAQAKKIAQLGSKLKVYEAGSSEEEIEVLRRKLLTAFTTVDDLTSMISNLQSEIEDLKQARKEDTEKVEDWVRQVSKLRSEQRSRKNAKIHELIEDTDRTHSVCLRLTKELSLKFEQFRLQIQTLETTTEERMRAAKTKTFYNQELIRWTKIIKRNTEGGRSTCSRAWSAHLKRSLIDLRTTPAWRELLHVIDQLLLQLEYAKK